MAGTFRSRQIDMVHLSDDEMDFMSDDDCIITSVTSAPKPKSAISRVPPAAPQSAANTTHNDISDLTAKFKSFGGVGSRTAATSSKWAEPSAAEWDALSHDLYGDVDKLNNATYMDVDYEGIDEINDKISGFPLEYAFLLSWKSINDNALAQHPELYELVEHRQQTVEMIIEREIAIVCLYWAQSYIECRTPLYEAARLTFEDERRYTPECGGSNENKMCRLSFRLEFPPTKRASFDDRNVKRGMVVRMQSGPLKLAGNVSVMKETFAIVSLRCRANDVAAYRHINDLPVTVHEVPQEFVPLSMLRSIRGMQEGFLDNIIMPRPQFLEPYEDYTDQRDADKAEFIGTYVKNTLTAPQCNAVYAIAKKAHGGYPFILYGPPGTGKTCTISAAIQVLLQLDAKNRVLVCTPSNMAADRVAEKLMEDFGLVLTKHNVLRLRSTGNDYMNRDKQFDSISSRDLLFEHYTIPKSYDRYRVVVCTLGCSSHLMRVEMDRGFFSHIIIDEAGQCSEAEMWIPIGGLADERTSVIMCGDPKQLGPVITLNLSPRITKRFQSPLVRYTDLPQYKNDERLCCLLSDCFRCPKMLVHMVSHVFYDGRLRHSGNHASQNHDFSLIGPPKEFPIWFVSVDAKEERQANGYSYANKTEADVIIYYAEQLIFKKKIAPKDIGIIAQYRYQIRVICDKIKASGRAALFREITIDSVERFQGSERSCILISTIRTEHLGFVADDLRVNTALTRAKNLLIVVGNERALSQHNSWQVFIRYCRQYLGYKKWDKYSDSVHPQSRKPIDFIN